MIQIPEESIDKLMQMVKEGYEVHMTYEPDRTEVEIMPWKPFEYRPRCPYNTEEE